MPPRLVRRAVAPVIVCAELALIVVFAAGAVVGLVAAPLTRPMRLLRVCGFAVGYLAVELVTGFAALGLWCRHPLASRRHPPPGWARDHERLLCWALGSMLAWAGRCFGFRVVVDLRPGPLDGTTPVMVLARHGGPGDSFALVHMLLSRGRRVHIVLKDVLQFDPALDVLLNRLGASFLPSRPAPDQDLPGLLAGAALGLTGRDTLLVFPEGGNWTPARRWRAIRRLHADAKPAAARAATLMTHVLPPRPAGVLSALDARPDLPVVIVAHAGLDRLVSARMAWSALPLTTPMTVRAWPAAPVPPTSAGEEARLLWLTTEWATVDEWVDAHRLRSQGPGRLAP